MTQAQAQAADEAQIIEELKKYHRQPLHGERSIGPAGKQGTIDGQAQNDGKHFINCPPEFVYPKSRDSRGHSVLIRIRVPTYWEAAVAEAVAKMPCYRSKEDLFRDAIHHRLSYLANHMPIARSEIAAILLEEEQIRYSELIAGAAKAYQSIGEKFKQALRAGDYTEAQRTIDGARAENEHLHQSVRAKLWHKIRRMQAALDARTGEIDV
jgi:hypothetical protein